MRTIMGRYRTRENTNCLAAVRSASVASAMVVSRFGNPTMFAAWNRSSAGPVGHGSVGLGDDVPASVRRDSPDTLYTGGFGGRSVDRLACRPGLNQLCTEGTKTE